MTRAGSRPQGGPRGPHPWLLALAGAGIVLSAYMVWTRAAHAPVFCPLGTGCDIVQSSRYAAVFGIPVAFLGFLVYAALSLIAARPLTRERRFLLAFPLAAVGVGASAVFTSVQLTAIRATCTLCLLSAILTVAIAAVLVAARPRRAAPGPWVVGAVALAAAVVFLLGGYAASRPPAAEQTYAAALARHLAATGVKLYGAYWCPHCEDQKAMFGPAAGLLPYVECDGRSPIGQPGVCAAAQVRAYPTWDIAGKRYEGVLSLEQLARLTGYQAPPP